jgi:phage gp36-like protein
LLITLLPDPANEVDLGVDEEGEEVGGNNGVDFEFGREGRGVELKAVKKQS